jgi:hypothetical protein
MHEGEDVDGIFREQVHEEMREATDGVCAPYALNLPNAGKV